MPPSLGQRIRTQALGLLLRLQLGAHSEPWIPATAAPHHLGAPLSKDGKAPETIRHPALGSGSAQSTLFPSKQVSVPLGL